MSSSGNYTTNVNQVPISSSFYGASPTVSLALNQINRNVHNHKLMPMYGMRLSTKKFISSTIRKWLSGIGSTHKMDESLKAQNCLDTVGQLSDMFSDVQQLLNSRNLAAIYTVNPPSLQHNKILAWILARRASDASGMYVCVAAGTRRSMNSSIRKKIRARRPASPQEQAGGRQAGRQEAVRVECVAYRSATKPQAPFTDHISLAEPWRLLSSDSSNYALALSYIVQELLQAYNEGSTLNLTKLKGQTARKYKLTGIPKMADILSNIPLQERAKLYPFLKTKPVRTASGVAVVAVMSKPHRCPHIALTGNVCVYCPGGPDSDFEYSTQAYTGYEPTSMRAIRARYDPYSQTKGRVAQLRAIGHDVDKIEFIVMGGTFLSLDKGIQGVLYSQLARCSQWTLLHVVGRVYTVLRTFLHQMYWYYH